MTEYQIKVIRVFGKLWYTLQKRRGVGWLIRTPWKDVYPTKQPSYEGAIKLKVPK